MLRQGVNVALGTDGAASNHSQDLFDTMKAASLAPEKIHHQDAGVIDPYFGSAYGDGGWGEGAGARFHTAARSRSASGRI